MNIKDVAKKAGLPAKTIRYYEDIGLISPNRADNGYRVFGDADTQRLAFIARARALGFSIEECRALLDLYNDGDRSSADVKRLAEEHLRQIEEKIAALTEMRGTLKRLVQQCQGDSRPDCPILADLAGAES
ncbi:Cu(I)-responsive transcriptional regulator [Litorisediminicola beolgyonensis]|uniref:Cu(I)-responsive transcriptional regulator n=1 Tax=Litorisediminicola beolgyonensis TaxID=1173614 RepID=A0ABW3ZCF5_9RHOB